jgi:hypothetical protein
VLHGDHPVRVVECLGARGHPGLRATGRSARLGKLFHLSTVDLKVSYFAQSSNKYSAYGSRAGCLHRRPPDPQGARADVLYESAFKESQPVATGWDFFYCSASQAQGSLGPPASNARLREPEGLDKLAEEAEVILSRCAGVSPTR